MRAHCDRYSTERSLSPRRSMRWHTWIRGARKARSSSPCLSQAHDDKKGARRFTGYIQVFAESLLGSWMVNADGSSQHRIGAYVGSPDWDSTGTRLAYDDGSTIYTVAGADSGP